MRRRLPRRVYASVFAPAPPGREWWAYTFVCPWCHLGHFGRARTEAAVPGRHRARCGAPVWLVVARTYRGR